MKGKTTCPKVVDLRVEMNRKVPPLSLASDPRELLLQMGSLQVAWGPLGGLAVVGWGQDPHRGRSQAWNGFCVHKISLYKRHWWGDGGGGSREITQSQAGSTVS